MPDVGFNREEMDSECLVSSAKTPAVAHVFVITGSFHTWSPRLELDPSSPVSELSALLADRGGAVRVTACEKSSIDDKEGDVLLMPMGLRVRTNDYVALGKAINKAILDGSEFEFESSTMSEAPHVFVCAHQSRDERCGACGPLVMRAVAERVKKVGLPRSAVDVRACSHIGGHKYAGNVLIFRPKRECGDWLGYVRPEDAAAIVDFAVSNDAHPPHELHASKWRGRHGESDHERVIAGVSCERCGTTGDVEDLVTPTMTKPNVVFVLGGPGSGKGTQCELLSKKRGYLHLSAGELLRNEQHREGSPHAEMIASHMVTGTVVPVDVTIDLLLTAMKGHTDVLVDAFPRNFDNLHGWERRASELVNTRGMLFVDTPVCELEGRLLERGKTSGRADDTLEVISKRMRTYEKDTLPVVNEFASKGRLVKVSGEGSVEEVYQRMEKAAVPLMKRGAVNVPSGKVRIRVAKKRPPPMSYGSLLIGGALVAALGAAVVAWRSSGRRNDDSS